MHLQKYTCMPLPTDETKTTIFSKPQQEVHLSILTASNLLRQHQPLTLGGWARKKRKNATETKIRVILINDWALDMQKL